MLTQTATVGKIISEILARDSGLTFARDARDLLIECCVEFITLISSEANEIAEKEAKKTIACEHVQSALNQLGYPDYIPEILRVAQEHKQFQAVRLLQRLNNTLTACRRKKRSRISWNAVVSRKQNCLRSKKHSSNPPPANITRHSESRIGQFCTLCTPALRSSLTAVR
jgi:histone H3/H4